MADNLSADVLELFAEAASWARPDPFVLALNCLDCGRPRNRDRMRCPRCLEARREIERRRYWREHGRERAARFGAAGEPLPRPRMTEAERRASNTASKRRWRARGGALRERAIKDARLAGHRAETRRLRAERASGALRSHPVARLLLAIDARLSDGQLRDMIARDLARCVAGLRGHAPMRVAA